METTTIQIHGDVKNTLDHMKLYSRETYNDVIVRLLEETEELNERTKKELDEARKEIKEGRFSSHEDVGKELGFV